MFKKTIGDIYRESVNNNKSFKWYEKLVLIFKEKYARTSYTGLTTIKYKFAFGKIYIVNIVENEL